MFTWCYLDPQQHFWMQESEYTTDGRDSHPSPAGTSRSDVSPQQLTAGSFLMWYVCMSVMSHWSTSTCIHNQPLSQCLMLTLTLVAAICSLYYQVRVHYMVALLLGAWFPEEQMLWQHAQVFHHRMKSDLMFHRRLRKAAAPLTDRCHPRPRAGECSRDSQQWSVPGQ